MITVGSLGESGYSPAFAGRGAEGYGRRGERAGWLADRPDGCCLSDSQNKLTASRTLLDYDAGELKVRSRGRTQERNPRVGFCIGL